MIRPLPISLATFESVAGGAPGCTLFADLSNPVSNRIYERLGYRRVGTCVTLQW